MIKPFPLSGALLGCLCLAFAAPAISQGTGSFTTFNVPGAGSGSLQGTFVRGIDTAGDIAGLYIDSLGASHGFERLADGTIQTFDVPGAGTTSGQGTIVTGINSTGTIAGYTIELGKTGYIAETGFVRSPAGTITTFTGPNSAALITVMGVNSVGSVTGSGGGITGGDGFVRMSGGSGINFSPTLFNQAPNVGMAINTAGVVTGRFLDNANISHGFVLNAAGTVLTPFDPPNLSTNATYAGANGSFPTIIDTAGDIAGSYTDSTGARHSFLRLASGAITPFDPPSTDSSSCPSENWQYIVCGSAPFGMNDLGQIVGAYFDTNGVSHGYLREASGFITTLDVPGAGTEAYQGTGAFGINAAGSIAGTYADVNWVLHGFIGTAPATTTVTALTAAQSASVFNEPASFTATVSSGAGTPANGEPVVFMSGTTQLGSATLNSGTANFTTTALPVGADSITAVYAGDATFSGSTSTAVRQTVAKATSFTTLSSLPNPSAAAQSVTFTAAVSGQFGGTATGSVTFSNGATSLGSPTLLGGSASITTSALPAGTDAITAVYNGDANFGASTSNTVSQVVTSTAPDFTIALSPSAMTVIAGASAPIGVTITPVNNFGSTVSFSCSGLPAGASCVFSPTTVTPMGGLWSLTNLALNTSSTTAALHRDPNPLFPGSVLAVALCCFGFKKRRRIQMLLLLVVSAAGLTLFTGCGGSGSVSSHIQSVTTTVTITATSGSLSHSTPFSLTVDTVN